MFNRKKICRFGSACYRRNPDHFRQTAHPHLDKLLDNIPDDNSIDLPNPLEFACTNRLLLTVQLKALRSVRKREIEEEETFRANVQPKDGQKVKMRQLSRAQTLAILSARGAAPDYLPEPGKFAEKHRNAAPYFIFFTTVPKLKFTGNQDISVTLSELLDKSLGKITCSLHLNFIVDVEWLWTEYMLAEQNFDLTVFCGEYDHEYSLPTNIKIYRISCPEQFGCHHTKLSILEYEDGGIRVIVSTANLYREDWQLRTQGLWMSPHLPRLPASASISDGESKMGFKKALMDYLCQYSNEMSRWRAIVKRVNFSAVNVALVFSVPGKYDTDSASCQWGHMKLATILKSHVEIPKDEERSTVVALSPALGSFGENYESWLGSEIVNSMSKTTDKDSEVDFKAIFPTLQNYKSSFDMQESANCLCYTERQHYQQAWLKLYLHKWSSVRTGRTYALPHISSFTRLSRDESKIWWYVLGSASLSKAAWGCRQGKNLCVLNYEASVVFLPKFVTGTTSFPVKIRPESFGRQQTETPTFPLPYDLPLFKYSKNDKPFVTEYFQKKDRVFYS